MVMILAHLVAVNEFEQTDMGSTQDRGSGYHPGPDSIGVPKNGGFGGLKTAPKRSLDNVLDIHK